MHLNSSSMILACNLGDLGGGGGLYLKGMVDGCGYLEVWRDFIYIFSSEMFSYICMGTDSRDLANGYPL
jgi:hypothetical protein